MCGSGQNPGWSKEGKGGKCFGVFSKGVCFPNCSSEDLSQLSNKRDTANPTLSPAGLSRVKTNEKKKNKREESAFYISL